LQKSFEITTLVGSPKVSKACRAASEWDKMKNPRRIHLSRCHGCDPGLFKFEKVRQTTPHRLVKKVRGSYIPQITPATLPLLPPLQEMPEPPKARRVGVGNSAAKNKISAKYFAVKCKEFCAFLYFRKEAEPCLDKYRLISLENSGFSARPFSGTQLAYLEYYEKSKNNRLLSK